MAGITAPPPGDRCCSHGGKLLLGMPVCSLKHKNFEFKKLYIGRYLIKGKGRKP